MEAVKQCYEAATTGAAMRFYHVSAYCKAAVVFVTGRLPVGNPEDISHEGNEEGLLCSGEDYAQSGQMINDAFFLCASADR